MILPRVYVALAIIVIALIFILIYFSGKKRRSRKLSPMAGIAFTFIVAGIVFGEDQLLGYSLIGAGVVLAFWDIWNKGQKKEEE